MRLIPLFQPCNAVGDLQPAVFEMTSLLLILGG